MLRARLVTNCWPSGVHNLVQSDDLREFTNDQMYISGEAYEIYNKMGEI